MQKPQEILLAEPRGFCAGVDRAIEIVERALQKFGRPIYVRHEIVHNTYVVNDLKAKGAIFIEELSDVPPGATLVFSAHGVSRAVQQEAQARGFSIFDATCPLVTKVHVEVAKLAKEGYEFIMIGHKGHPEVEGTMGQLDHGIHLVEDVADVARVQPAQTEKLAVVTQTTLSVDDAAQISAAVRARTAWQARPVLPVVGASRRAAPSACARVAATGSVGLVSGRGSSAGISVPCVPRAPIRVAGATRFAACDGAGRSGGGAFAAGAGRSGGA